MLVMLPINHPARVRFAPSPTGHLHLGSGRTALFDYLLARQTGGQFILRLEDSDRKRLVPGAEDELMKGLRWLGLEWDEGPDVGGPYAPYRQSERKDIYLDFAKKLIDAGNAFYCFCSPDHLEKVRQEQQKMKISPRYDGTCRKLAPDEADRRVVNGEKHVIRFKTPQEGTITVKDLLRGEITVENRNLDDYIIVRSDGLALYHLAAMVDDYLMGITHVIRGSEWLPTFPLHGHIVRAFNWPEPQWIHLSVFLKPSGKGKMSKRDKAELIKDGYSIFLKDLESLGYLPEAVVNWITLMGWSYDDHTELFSLKDLVEKFSLNHLNPAPAAINFTKLDHFNGVYIRGLEIPDLARRIHPFFEKSGYVVDTQKLEKITPIIQERIGGLDEAPSMAGFFFEDEVHPIPQELVGKKMTAVQSAEVAKRAYQVLETILNFRVEELEQHMRLLVDDLDLSAGQVFGILRVAVTGQAVSPPLFESMEIIGKEKVLQRVRKAIELLEEL
jgi:glutamyl-tRNA synthetase